MNLYRAIAALAAVLLVGTGAFAQTTSNLTGRVSMDGNPLPGVTVTIASPSLQGTRTTVTDVNGNYNFAALPPGDYTVRFEMESMQTITRTQRIGLGQTGRVDTEMRLSAVAEAITVTASAPAVLETTEVQSNYTAELVDDLPIQRTFQAQANLAPHVTTNATFVGSTNQLVIAGAPSYENLYMVNGAVINENLRGQIHNLFIEDAIQETTVLTGAISAEYGRFSGGVVNSITKSGGNEFSGSFRDSLTNPSWTSKSFEDQTDFTDTLNEVYEATLGGRIVRDRLWFFAAGRYTEQSIDQRLFGTEIPLVFIQENRRLEGKLTGQITSRHNVQASYLDVQQPEGPFCFLACYEMSNVDPQRELPNSFATAHYSGIFSSNFLGEINYSRKKFAFEGSGGDFFEDRARGTWGLDPYNVAFFGAPVFCGVCGAEERNNDYLDAKLTYYLASKSLGTHNIVGGYQDWAEQRISNNYQSASSFGIYTWSPQTPLSGPNDVFRPHIAPGDWITYWPILELTQGSNFVTRSLYVNDKWDLNDRWQFSIGLRYDKNDGTDAGGNKRADDSLVSPRLGAIYDVFGNGRFRLNASYGKYVAKIAETIGGGATGAGTPAYLFYLYDGPEITGLPTVQAFERLFQWFDSVGGTSPSNPYLFYAQFPGVNVVLPESLKSPNVTEYTLGVGTAFGSGYARLDYIDRDWADFYALRTTGGKVSDPYGQPSDLQEIFTSNAYNRSYRGVSLQASYPLGSRFQLGGNYTWSQTRGNVLAETAGNGPVTENQDQYPEFRAFAQNNPTGFLPNDQTHKARAWATWTLPTPVGNFTFSALQRYDSGTAYSAIGTVNFLAATDDEGELVHPYVHPQHDYEAGPATINYFFGGRGAHRWDDVSALDLSVNYRLNLGRFELFIQPELVNVFNENAVINGNTSIRTADSGPVTVLDSNGNPVVRTLQVFNPFTETPIQGVHWDYARNAQGEVVFGTPRNYLDYQLGRTFRVSAGIRF